MRARTRAILSINSNLGNKAKGFACIDLYFNPIVRLKETKIAYGNESIKVLKAYYLHGGFDYINMPYSEFIIKYREKVVLLNREEVEQEKKD